MKVVYPTRERVSIWLGSFASEDLMDRAIQKNIEPALKLSTHISRICEGSFQEIPLSIQELLDGFSGSKTFIAEAVAEAEKKKIGPLNSALVCYYVDCIDAPEKWGDFIFLGTFKGYG